MNKNYRFQIYLNLIFILFFIVSILGCQNSEFQKNITLEQYPQWLRNYFKNLKWRTYKYEPKLNRQILLESFRLGRQFIINNQKKEGNFNYQYDFVEKEMDKNDNQVRQAGTLWSLALMYQFEQNQKNRKALDKGISFFLEHTKQGPVEGSLIINYPGNLSCQTGTVALVGLAIIDYLRTIDNCDKKTDSIISEEFKAELKAKLDGYINFLKYMRLENKHFSSGYFLNNNTKSLRFSPYFDGEVILCLTKAAKYLDYKELVPLIEDSAIVMAKYYTIDAWKKEEDSKLTKGFYQWSSMAFTEYYDAGWKNAEVFADYVLTLAHWMIYTHKTLKRIRNTAYAYEGIISAFQVAKSRNNEIILNNLAYTIDKVLYKLTSWQVGGPLQKHNRFLKKHPTNDPLAVGGIMNHKKEPLLRIDVTQHQMHAVILALRNIWKE